MSTDSKQRSTCTRAITLKVNERVSVNAKTRNRRENLCLLTDGGRDVGLGTFICMKTVRRMRANSMCGKMIVFNHIYYFVLLIYAYSPVQCMRINLSWCSETIFEQQSYRSARTAIHTNALLAHTIPTVAIKPNAVQPNRHKQ